MNLPSRPCFFCKKDISLTFVGGNNFICHNHSHIVHHMVHPNYEFICFVNYSATIGVYLYNKPAKCRILSLVKAETIAEFDFIPDFTPENIESKLKIYLPFI